MVVNSSTVIFGSENHSCRETSALKESCHSWDKLMVTLQGGGFPDLAEEISISQKSEKPGMTCASDEIHLLQMLKNPVRAAIFQYSRACLCKQPDETLVLEESFSMKENKKIHWKTCP